MPVVSIVLSCYNGEFYLKESVESIIHQEFRDWELVIINDGSTDKSLDIAQSFSQVDNRIRVYSKVNGGLNSARLYGLNFISEDSEFLLFSDADDVLHPLMILRLWKSISKRTDVGAVYCNHELIDGKGTKIGHPTYGVRLVPTLFWMKGLKESISVTPFISIFCWATKMIEPMTLIRRMAYEKSCGWDRTIGRREIGEGVLLFSEIALKWRVLYTDDVYYYYRKHTGQITTTLDSDLDPGLKVNRIWRSRLGEGYPYTRDIRGALICYEHRLAAYTKSFSLKYTIRNQFKSLPALVFQIVWHWTLSLRLVFFLKTKVFDY